VIHHGVDPDAFPVGDGGGGYLLFLGRMTAEKGVHRAVQVARATKRPLLIAAKMREASEHRYFATQVEPLLGNGIEFVGEVAGDRKLELIANASALINPIRWPEPFGMVMIESLACGTPVLSFREGAASEIITHGVDGILADTDAELVLAAGLGDQLDRGACRAKVLAHFTTAHMVAAHLEVYRARCLRTRGVGVDTRSFVDVRLPRSILAAGTAPTPVNASDPAAAHGC
jgi:glycosyltransferase involved in cell wall biosynthesis